MPPQTDNNQTTSGFSPALYSRSNAPMLYMPIIDPSSGKRMAVDPRTGGIYNNPLIGLFIPGTGSVSNGAGVGGGDGHPGGPYTTGAMYLRPPFGVVWGVFGTRRTPLPRRASMVPGSPPEHP